MVDVETKVQATRERLEQLAKNTSEPAEFFAEFLEELQTVAPFQLAAVWGLNQQGVVEKIAELRGKSRITPELASTKQRIHQVLQLLTTEKSQPPTSTDPTTVLIPLTAGDRAIGAVEVVLSDADSHCIENIKHLCEPACEFTTRIAVTAPRGEDFADQLLSLSLLLHQHLDLHEVALAAVNEGQRFLNCDRVSLAVKKRGKVVVKAISGLQKISQRSESASGLRGIAEIGFSCEQMLRWADNNSENSEILAEQASQTGARHVLAIPLLPPAMASDDSTPESPNGILILEQFSAGKTLDEVRATRFAEHVATAVRNAQVHGRLATSIPGRLLNRFYSSRKPQAKRAIAWILAGLVVLAAVGFLPAQYWVEARGQLLPAVRSNCLHQPMQKFARYWCRAARRLNVVRCCWNFRANRWTRRSCRLPITSDSGNRCSPHCRHKLMKNQPPTQRQTCGCKVGSRKSRSKSTGCNGGSQE